MYSHNPPAVSVTTATPTPTLSSMGSRKIEKIRSEEQNNGTNHVLDLLRPCCNGDITYFILTI